MKTFLKVWLGISFIAVGLGIVLLILAAGTGVKFEKTQTFSVNDTYEGVEKLDIDINYGEVKIIKGTDFSISADHLTDDGLESYVSDGTWTIRESDSRYIDVFGLKLPVHNIFHWNEDYSPKIQITIPENFTADNFSLKVAAGNVEADEILAEDGYFEVDAGRLKIDRLEIEGKSEYTVGTGTMVLQNTDIKDITVDCGVGNVEIEGTLTGDNEISCGVGRVALDLIGDVDDYSYDIDSGIGNVAVADNNYKNASNKIIKNDDALYNLDLDCGIGSIDIKFK
jgi:hypothetical protein